MRLSEAEQKIKRDLAERALQPSDALWENIQKELDQKQSKSKPAYLWWKVGSVAAVLCLAFLAYQGFQSTTSVTIPDVVLDSKPIKTKTIDIKAEDLDVQIAYSRLEVKSSSTQPFSSQEDIADVIDAPVQTPDVESIPQIDEAEMLLAMAQEELKMQNDEKLVAEVNRLIEEAMSETDNVQQKAILKDMKATVLLAEVESEIELEKPPLLKDKIWDALVFNFNQVKSNIVLN
jgi:hypothetical protein